MYKYLLAAAILAVVAQVQAQKPSRLDAVDIDAVLSNKRLLKNYIDCLANSRPCTPEGTELKRILPDALKTECANCSEKQKQNTRKIIRFFINDNNGYWDKLSKIYDPTGEYIKHYCEVAKREGFPSGQRCVNI